MKKRIQWSRTMEEKLQKDEWREQLTGLWGIVAFDVIFALIFQYAACSLLEESYGELLEFSGGLFLTLFVINLLISGLMTAAFRLPKKTAWLLCLLPPLVSGGYFWWKLSKEEFRAVLFRGLGSMAQEYAGGIREYYGVSINFPARNAEFAPEAVSVVLVLLFAVLLWLAKLGAGLSLLAVPAVLVFTSELLIGESQAGTGVFALFAGLLLVNSKGFLQNDFTRLHGRGEELSGKKQWLFLPGLIGLLLFGTVLGFAAKESAERQITEHSEVLQEMIMDTVERVVEWEVWTSLEGPEKLAEKLEKLADSLLADREDDRAVLDNEEPQFDNTPYLLVTTEQRQKNRMYLKGFAAGIYEDGTWINNPELFQAACRKAGYRASDMAEYIAALGITKLKKIYHVEMLRITGTKTSVFYYEPKTKMAYLPYFSDALEAGLTAVREGDLEKWTGMDEIEFTLWLNSSNYTEYLSSFTAVGKEDWEAWYENYVTEQYLTVPEQLVTVKAVAEQLKDQTYTGEEIKATRLNRDRMEKAWIVADWLGRNCTYSKKLPEVPKGADPIEYFLSTSEKGYCMHFASAGVMLLRELGVPARYASGYVVSRAEFSDLDREDHQAIVLDNQAHAWVEIYLEGVGWVPVEVTAGYVSLLPTPAPSPTVTPRPTSRPVPTLTPTNTPTRAPEATETPAPTIKPTDTPTLAPSPTPAVTEGAKSEEPQITPMATPETSFDGPGTEGSGKPEDSLPADIINMILKLLFTVGSFLLIGVLGKLYVYFKPVNVFTRRLKRETKRYGNTAAIRLINRESYRYLLHRRKLKAGLTDEGFEETVRRLYGETAPESWDAYFKLAEEAAYSRKEFTEEDILFCYKMYWDVIRKS